jgi:large-conductance mechanosensitive channel
MSTDIVKINKLVNTFVNDFGGFIYEQKIIGYFVGTFAGIASATFITSFKKNVLDYILTKIFNLGTLNSLFFITSILEYILMLIALYFIIKLIKPYFDKRDAEIKNTNDTYQTKLLATLENINNKLDQTQPTTK